MNTNTNQVRTTVTVDTVRRQDQLLLNGRWRQVLNMQGTPYGKLLILQGGGTWRFLRGQEYEAFRGEAAPGGDEAHSGDYTASGVEAAREAMAVLTHTVHQLLCEHLTPDGGGWCSSPDPAGELRGIERIFRELYAEAHTARMRIQAVSTRAHVRSRTRR